MGNVRLSIDLDKVLALKRKYDLRFFVETGTYKMGTTLLAQPHFERVVTIEAYEPRYRKNMATLNGNCPENVDFLFGDSRTWLGNALRKLDAPALIWLDAHWCGNYDLSLENGDECPLHEELDAVLASAYADQHVVMIDDARLFTEPPPRPHDASQWMTYAEIEAMLAPRRLYIEDDVIYAEPAMQ